MTPTIYAINGGLFRLFVIRMFAKSHRRLVTVML